MDTTGVIITAVVITAISLLILHLVIKSAVTQALRRARHEDRVEKTTPEETPWLLVDQRKLLVESSSRRSAPTSD